MKALTNDDLEGLNDTLAAAMREGSRMGIISASTLHQLCCEVQAWRRWDGARHEYNPNDHEIIMTEAL